MNARFRLNLKQLTLSVLCATACLASTATVSARPNDVPRVTVYYGDLNLQRPAAVASLYRRIERAAKRVCARPNARDLGQVYAARKCTAEAIDRAVVGINMPTLAQYAAGASTSAG